VAKSVRVVKLCLIWLSTTRKYSSLQDSLGGVPRRWSVKNGASSAKLLQPNARLPQPGVLDADKMPLTMSQEKIRAEICQGVIINECSKDRDSKIREGKVDRTWM